jgi:hypothetical protein
MSRSHFPATASRVERGCYGPLPRLGTVASAGLELSIAFNAETPEEIWNSTKDPRDTVGALAKFVIPVIANGRLYLATSSNAVKIFGLR